MDSDNQPDTASTTVPATMKRVVYRRFGGPEVLEIEEAPVPRPKKGEVLVRMLATSVNGGDLPLRQGSMGIVSTLTRFPQTLGIDVVGVVVALGPGVQDLAVGDTVWGNAGPKSDATAEYVAIRSKYVSLVPEGLDPSTAAAFPTAGLTALAALSQKGRLKAGDRVLVRGTGGVGLTAVQIAKALGAQVTALSSASTVDTVKSYGADEAFDYRTTSSADLGEFDVVFDTAGKGLGEFRKNLAPHGRMVTVVVSSIVDVVSSWRWGARRTRIVFAYSTKSALDRLSVLVREGSVRPVIDSAFPMEDIVEAHRRAETRGLLGKVIITIARP